LEQNVRFSIRFIDPQLNHADLEEEVRYLIEDLRDLDGMGQVRFDLLPEVRGTAETHGGIQFETEAEYLGIILRRLRDRLYYQPLETSLLIHTAGLSLQVQTHRADDLLGLMAIAQSRLLVAPERDYLAAAETYSRTQGELSATEMDNLNLLRQRLGLSVEQAEVLNARATGLYKTQADKYRHFEAMTQAEFSRLRTLGGEPPVAPKPVWPTLQDLAEQLGLPLAEAEAIYQAHRQRYDTDLARQREQAVAQAAEADRTATVAAQEGDRQAQTHQAQVYRNQYRDLCRRALANGLYPTEYDQGRLDQARRLRHIPLAEAVALETAVRDELYGPVASSAGVDYTRLRLLLSQREWRAADLETESALLKALNCDMQPATPATVTRLSPVDLATLDGLWSRYSQGRFGFKAQQQAYRGQEQIQPDEPKRWSTFQQLLGWREPSSLLSLGFKPYDDLIFSLDAPSGHLPSWRWGCPSPGHRCSPTPEVMAAIMEHLNRCLPLGGTAVADQEPTLVVGGTAYGDE
jgi:hypothetical protein